MKTNSRGNMNGLIKKIKRYLKTVVLRHITSKYKDQDLNGRLQYLQELHELIDHQTLAANIVALNEGEVLSTKFTDIKAQSRNVVNVVQRLRDNQNIDFFIIKSDPVRRDLVSFMLTSEGKYIDPKPYIDTLLEYSLQIREHVKDATDKESSVYLHNSYLLLHYVEDLISITREFIRISNR